MVPRHSSGTTGPTVLPNAVINQVQNSDIAGRDIIEQEGVNNIIGNHNFLGNQTIVVGNPNSSKPIQRLLFYCALDALVDSKDRHDWEQFLPPRCAPETRERILQSIIRWVNQSLSVPDFLWLTGSAGSGKSAICQTIAEIFKRKGELLANFFFSRGAGSSGRSNGYRLIPTIIWQIQKNLPETRSQIKQAIRNDPSLLTSTPANQMEALCCMPLNQFSVRRWLRELVKKQIRLIVIDGLDECQGSGVQCDLLRVIADTATRLTLPLRFLIASRPEAHITETFHGYTHLMAAAKGRINLDEDDDARISILKFVQARVRDILATHPWRQTLLEASWPSEEAISFIVSKSTPQFIFASTVMNYISSPEDRPDRRLNTIISIVETKPEGSAEAPLESLDKLYRFIFLGVNPTYQSSVRAVLSIIYLASRQEFSVPTPSPNFFEGYCGLPVGGVTIGLRPLLSIISIPEDRDEPIISLHASLFDFLLDQKRSGDLALDLLPAHLCLLDHYGRLTFQESQPPSFFLGILRHAAQVPLAKERRPSIEHIATGLFHSIESAMNMGIDASSMLIDMSEAFNAVQLVSELLEEYETDEEGYGHSQVLETAIRIPADIGNPFVSPFSTIKYCAFVRIFVTFSPDIRFQWLVKILSDLDDTETLMHLITAFAAVTVRETYWLQGKGAYPREVFEVLEDVGVLLAEEEAYFSMEIELPALCRKSVIHLCKHILNSSPTYRRLDKPARKALKVWTCLGGLE